MKNVAYYRTLPYTRRVEREEHNGDFYFVARILDLPGCIATGDTRAEALAALKSAFDDYIEAKLHWGARIPEPSRAPKGQEKPDEGTWQKEERSGTEVGPTKELEHGYPGITVDL